MSTNYDNLQDWELSIRGT